MKTVDELYEDYKYFSDDPGLPVPDLEEYVSEIARYLWNGWGKTILDAAHLLIFNEFQYQLDGETHDVGWKT